MKRRTTSIDEGLGRRSRSATPASTRNREAPVIPATARYNHVLARLQKIIIKMLQRSGCCA